MMKDERASVSLIQETILLISSCSSILLLGKEPNVLESIIAGYTSAHYLIQTYSCALYFI